MRQLIYIVSIAVLYAISSCSSERIADISQNDTNIPSQVISPERALDNLRELMMELYPETKSDVLNCNPEDLLVVGAGATKSGMFPIPDTAMYILNFAEESGFAVMAAQTCMETQVFCITEAGSLYLQDIDKAFEFLESQNMQIEDSDTTAVEFISMGEDFVPVLLAASAVNQYSPNISASIWDLTAATYTYKNVTKKGPFLLTKWSQRKPFNNFRSDNAPVGCVAIATAQILAHNEHGSAGGRTFDWTLLKTVYPYNAHSSMGSKEAQQEASNFLQFVGNYNNCRIRYSTDGSGGWADGAKRTFKNFGYKNVKKYLGFEKADKQRVINMLSNYLPVYTDGSRGLTNGHAWVIDGLYNRDKYTIGINSQKVASERFFHINWGWHGQSDGYYNQGVFDTTKRVETDGTIDNGTVNTDKPKYTWNYRTITYSL